MYSTRLEKNKSILPEFESIIYNKVDMSFRSVWGINSVGRSDVYNSLLFKRSTLGNSIFYNANTTFLSFSKDLFNEMYNACSPIDYGEVTFLIREKIKTKDYNSFECTTTLNKSPIKMKLIAPKKVPTEYQAFNDAIYIGMNMLQNSKIKKTQNRLKSIFTIIMNGCRPHEISKKDIRIIRKYINILYPENIYYTFFNTVIAIFLREDEVV